MLTYWGFRRFVLAWSASTLGVPSSLRQALECGLIHTALRRRHCRRCEAAGDYLFVAVTDEKCIQALWKAIEVRNAHDRTAAIRVPLRRNS